MDITVNAGMLAAVAPHDYAGATAFSALPNAPVVRPRERRGWKIAPVRRKR